MRFKRPGQDPNDQGPDPTRTRTLLPFRGILTDVSELGNDPESIREKASLGWKAYKIPLMLQGSREARPYGRFAIVHGRSGKPIDGGTPVSENYVPPDNLEILGDMCQFSQDLGLRIQFAGQVRDGQYLMAYAASPKVLDITPKDKGYAYHLGDLSKGANQDLVEAGILMIASHTPGVASRWKTLANRFVCSNQVIIGSATEGYRLPHRGRYDSMAVRKVFEKFGLEFEDYCQIAQSLAETASPKLIQQAYLAEVLEPGLLDSIISKTQGILDISPGEFQVKRSFFLDSLMSQDAVERIFLESLQEKGHRNLSHVIDSMESQPGVEFVRGSLAQPYQAITHWVDHDRGRSGDASLMSAVNGEGQKLKASALQVALEYMTVGSLA